MILRRTLLVSLPAILIAALFCCCGTVPRNVPYNDADYTRYHWPGTGIVQGQSTVEYGHDTFIGANTVIDLDPVSPYTTETIERQLIRGVNLAPIDPRLYPHMEEVTTDANGNFKFTNVPTGEYWVHTFVQWHDEDFNDEYRCQWIYTKVNVRNGYTTTIGGWDQGFNWMPGLLWGNH